MKTIESHAIKFGAITTALLIAYFLVMKAFGLVHNINLRFFNGVIMAVGIYWSISNLKKNDTANFSYFRGIAVGVATSFSVAVMFVIFMIAYMMIFPDFLMELKTYEPQGIHLNYLTIGLMLFIEAMASGSMISFISMQWLKKNRISEARQKEEHRRYSLNH